MKRYPGQPPIGGELVTVLDGWMLWRRLTGATRWVDLKLTAVEPTAHKANYWLRFCLELDEMLPGGDFELLKTHHPTLAEGVLAEARTRWSVAAYV